MTKASQWLDMSYFSYIPYSGKFSSISPAAHITTLNQDIIIIQRRVVDTGMPISVPPPSIPLFFTSLKASNIHKTTLLHVRMGSVFLL